MPKDRKESFAKRWIDEGLDLQYQLPKLLTLLQNKMLIEYVIEVVRVKKDR